jgi:hypothetical protein
MSRTLERKVQNFAAMVRAYGDEPVSLLVRTHLGRAVELEFAEGGNTVIFPADDVYCFDERLFAELRNAFQTGDRARLVASWHRARRFDTE